MLILISLLPGYFALNPKIEMGSLKSDIQYIQETLDQASTQNNVNLPASFLQSIDELSLRLEETQPEAHALRSRLLHFQSEWKKLSDNSALFAQAEAASLDTLIHSPEMETRVAHVSQTVDYAPWWVIALISISLGIGTMFGWKRIVKTLGKKIGNHKLSYAESTSSALITAGTITIASRLGLPVSTTHIFSSSIAGCMMTGKKPGLQEDTVKHIVLAWVLTLPITICVSGLLFSFFWFVFF